VTTICTDVGTGNRRDAGRDAVPVVRYVGEGGVRGGFWSSYIHAREPAFDAAVHGAGQGQKEQHTLALRGCALLPVGRSWRRTGSCSTRAVPEGRGPVAPGQHDAPAGNEVRCPADLRYGLELDELPNNNKSTNLHTPQATTSNRRGTGDTVECSSSCCTRYEEGGCRFVCDILRRGAPAASCPVAVRTPRFSPRRRRSDHLLLLVLARKNAPTSSLLR